MANRAVLLDMHSTDPPWDHDGGYLHDGLLGANVSVPVLWRSLFDTDGLVTWPSIHDGSPYTAVIQPTSECIERSRTRLREWTRRWPQVFAEMSETWLSYVDAVQEPYLGVWTEELTWFHDDDSRWAAQFHDELTCLDDPESAGFRAELAHIGLGSDGRFEPHYFVGVLTAGYTWTRQAPWEGAGHGPYFKGPDTLADIEAHLRECRACTRWPEGTR